MKQYSVIFRRLAINILLCICSVYAQNTHGEEILKNSSHAEGDKVAFLYNHPFRGNISRKAPHIQSGAIPAHAVCYAFNGPDVIHEHRSVAMHAAVRDAGNSWNPVSRIRAIVSREWTLIRAAHKASMGQDRDLNAIKIEECTGTHKKFVVFGHSKGGALSINLAGSGRLQEIAAVVAIAPYDHGDSVARSFPPLCYVHRFFQSIPLVGRHISIVPLVNTLVLRGYDRNGIQPITSVKDIGKDIPVVVALSYEDCKVPADQQLRLYIALREAGCNAFLLETNYGDHETFLQDKRNTWMIGVLNSLYKHVGAPHTSALIGSHDIFAKSDTGELLYQPSVATVQSKLRTIL